MGLLNRAISEGRRVASSRGGSSRGNRSLEEWIERIWPDAGGWAGRVWLRRTGES